MVAIIVAAGRGERLSEGLPKAFVDIASKSILRRSAEALAACDEVAALIVVAPEGFEARAREEAGATGKLRAVVSGGKTRQDSVRAGIARTSPADRIVLVHDAARPFVEEATIARVIAAARRDGAAIPVTPVIDTIKRVRNGRVGETVDRSVLGAAQTPQGFKRSLLLDVYGRAVRAGVTLTDEAMAVERQGLRVAAVEGSPANFKITTPEDLGRARGRFAASRTQLRVGHGFDTHRLVEGTPLMLGGIRVPSDVGLLGHSDGDVLLHAICDATLGAVALGEIGTLFPSSDRTLFGISSSHFVDEVKVLLDRASVSIVNLDATLIAERPRLSTHLQAMKENVARLFGLSPDQVSIKVKSADRLGAIGRGEGIAAQVLVLVASA